MRNLKKFLALVLAMMMTLSLMITVNAKDVTTDFSDSESVTESFQEGLQVLAGMKVFEGYTDGTFKPKNNITRAEVATIVYRIATGDAEGTQEHLYVSGADKFVDVADDHWAAGAIGYCANNLLVLGYDNVHFGPNNNVTGVQALAMILRAVGYGKNGEFQGNGWETRVYGRAQNKGLLVNVNNTTYASRLTQVAPRELVAELLFQAAQIPQVTWTMLGDYSETIDVLGTKDKNPSLGTQNYGLTWGHGIIIGNQETGYTSTQWGTTRGTDSDGNATFIDNSKPVYAPTATQTVALKMDTGLAEFGHNYKVWYDYRGTTHTVYAAEDKVVKTQLVYAADTELTGGTNNYLGGIVTDSRMGFKLAHHDNGTGTEDAYYSTAFGTPVGPFERRTAGDESAQDLYLVISNSANNAVDMVVAVNTQINKISKVDNLATTKTVDVGRARSAFYNASTNGRIDQDDLFGKPCITLNAKVVANAIGTIADGTAAADGYTLHEMTNVVTGTVTASHTGTDRNFDADYVMVDGKKIEKSLLWYENAHDGSNAANNNTIGRVDDDSSSTINTSKMTNFTGGTYRFYLDADGKYMAAERVYGEEFIYGTYVDYEQATSTSTFNYYVTGVNLKGEVVTKQFVNWNNSKFDGNFSRLGIAYRSANATSAVGTSAIAFPNAYNGTVLSGTDLSNGNGNSISPENLGVHHEPGTPANGDYIWNSAALLSITKRDAAVGAIQVASVAAGQNTYQANGANNSAPIYLTNNTQFYLVSGNGTDTIKVTDVKGLTGLLGNNSTINIDPTRDTQFYYTTSDFYYASNGVYAKQIDTIIMPASAILGNTGVYFYGGPGDGTDKILNDGNGKANGKYALYVNGEKVEVWLSAQPTTEAFKTLTLIPTGDVASDGQPIYVAADVADANLPNYGVIESVDNEIGTGEVAYLAATRDATVATIGSKIYNVANAKVVNFVTGITIKTVQDLNEASTRYAGVEVFATSSDGINVDAIYVMETGALRP